MNDQELIALVARQSAAAIVDTLLALPVDERRRLAPFAAELWREIDGGRVLNRWRVLSPLIPGESTTQTALLGRHWREQHARVSLVVLALCPIDKAKRVRWLGLRDADDLLRRVFVARDARWRDAWLRHRLQDDFPGVPWTFVRGLVRDGVCCRPENSEALRGYLRLMVSDLNPGWSRPGVAYVPLSARLLADPSLLDEEIWQLFALDTPAFDDAWLRNHPQRPTDYQSWSDALIGLAGAGRIDRQRLLDASLAGLWASSRTTVLAGCHKLHSRLAPGPDELDAREVQYRELLSHRSGHVVGFALRQLAQIARRRPLPAEPTLSSMAPLFALPARAQPLAALKLVERILAEKTPDGGMGGMGGVTHAAYAVLREALRHPAGEVQLTAAQLLRAHAGAWSDDQLAGLREVGDELSPLAREPLAALGHASLGGTKRLAPSEPRQNVAAAGSAESAELADLSAADQRRWRTRVQALPSRVRALGGLAGEVDFSRPPPPLAFALTDVPVLATVPRLAPIDSVDELIDGVAHAIETIDSFDEIERIVDAIARLFDERPADFAARTQALVKRMYTGALADARGLVLPGVPNGLRDLVLTWLEGGFQHTNYPFYRQARGPMRFIDRRLWELARHLDQHGALPPLATPTHAHGWIAPRTLVERLIDYESSHRRPLACDLLQALLRLAPDARDEALAMAGTLRGASAAAVRWALGGDSGPRRQDRKESALWIAAGRARCPHGDLRGALAPLAVNIPWPDVLRSAEYQWQAVTRTLRQHRRESTCPGLDVRVAPAYPGTSGGESPTLGGWTRIRTGAGWFERMARWLRRKAPALALRTLDPILALPTCLPHESAAHRSLAVGYSAPWLIAWAATLWPLNIDASLALGARLMVERIDLAASAGEPLHSFLDPLFESNRPWSEPGMLVLWIGMASRDGDLRRLACDLLIEGVRDGRAHPVELADILRHLSAGGWLKINRLTESLAEVARVSPLHQWTVASVIESALDVFVSQAGKASLALGLLHELLVGLQCGPAAETAQRLAGITGGKAGLAARAILALTERPSLRTSSDVLLPVWEARLVRLEGWTLTKRV